MCGYINMEKSVTKPSKIQKGMGMIYTDFMVEVIFEEEREKEENRNQGVLAISKMNQYLTKKVK